MDTQNNFQITLDFILTIIALESFEFKENNLNISVLTLVDNIETVKILKFDQIRNLVIEGKYFDDTRTDIIDFKFKQLDDSVGYYLLVFFGLVYFEFNFKCCQLIK